MPYPALGKARARLDLVAVTLSRRAWDRGNRSIGRLSHRILDRIQGDDMVMLHDSKPPSRGQLLQYLNEVGGHPGRY